ncbi:MAG: oligosaccharide flippase family protein [Sedimentisphaerales bacterium]|nr:oligosaccharide flippase family protein [Sedimentisphaerales bacterium]
MSLRKKVILNAGSNWMSMFVMAVIGLYLVRVFLHELGRDAFGVWALLSTGLRYPMILERAFVLAMNRFAAFYREDKAKLNSLITSSFVILAFFGIVTILISILLSFFISDLFAAITEEFSYDAKITCILVGTTLALKMLEATFSGVLQGHHYYTRYNIVVTTTNIFRAILTLILFVFWKSIIAFQFAFCVTAAVSAISMYFLAKKSITDIRVSLRLVDKNNLRELWEYTSHSIARSGSSIFMFSSMALLVGAIGNASHVAIYDIGQRIPTFLRGFFASTQVVFLPAVSGLWSQNRIDAIKAVLKKGTRISSVIACAFIILLFIFADRILIFWLEGNVPEGADMVMRLLLISVLPGGLFEIWLPALVGMGFLRGLTIASIATAVGSVLLAGLLIVRNVVSEPIAPAVALICAMWIKTGLWLPIYGLKKLNMSLVEYFKESMLKPIVASCICIIALLVLNNLSIFENVHWLLMFGLSMIITLVCFSIVSMRSETIELYVNIKRKISSKR